MVGCKGVYVVVGRPTFFFFLQKDRRSLPAYICSGKVGSPTARKVFSEKSR